MFTHQGLPSVRSISQKLAVAAVLVAVPFLPATVFTAAAQTAPAAARVQGTVKSISGNTITVAVDGTPAPVTVTIADGARVQQSADLKTVSAATLDQLAVGDRVLAMGAPGDSGAFAANRLIMIKSTTIDQRNAASQADWAKRGSGGIVKSVNPSTNTVNISSGKRDVEITVTDSTIYRRYAPGSIKFEDAQPSTLPAIQSGDQLRVRGDKSPDGSKITADEIVSGSFKNLSGTIVSVNTAASSFVIKDLATKKNETVVIGEGSDLRSLPATMAARFGNGGGQQRTAGAEGGAAGQSRPSGAEQAGGEQRAARPEGAPGGAAGASRTGGAGRPADLSSMIPRLPKTTLADLKAGEALMIVASGSTGPYTAITVLSGVEPLLTGPAGSGMTISPWSLGSGGGAEGGGATE